jgi:ATP-dependent Clp protease ATP-binding subunit ClpA
MEVAGQVRESDTRRFTPSWTMAKRQVEDLAAKQAQLKELEAELEKRQERIPLVQIAVDAETVSAVVSGWTGIPTGTHAYR